MKPKKALKCCLLMCAMLLPSTPTLANSESVQIFSTQDSFDDVVFEVENGIVNRGYVVDYVAHIGQMLERTAADVGATSNIYREARSLQFCSAVLSREAMEADPSAIAFCPYTIFVYERSDSPGVVYVGYRPLPTETEKASKTLSAVNDLLESISREAAGESEN